MCRKLDQVRRKLPLRKCSISSARFLTSPEAERALNRLGGMDPPRRRTNGEEVGGGAANPSTLFTSKARRSKKERTLRVSLLHRPRHPPALLAGGAGFGTLAAARIARAGREAPRLPEASVSPR